MKSKEDKDTQYHDANLDAVLKAVIIAFWMLIPYTIIMFMIIYFIATAPYYAK
jgi:hypothetical protein